MDPHKEQGIIAANEMEMMKQIVYGAEVSSQWNIVSIETPNVPLVGAGYRTANTGDTFTKWRQDVKPEGKFLVVSNQPFVRYQETNARRIIGPSIQFVGIGQEADTNLPLCLFLDNLAKQFYEEKMLAGLGPV